MTDSEQANVLEGRRVAVLGCGIMGEAMIASMLKGGLVGSDQVVGAEPIDWRRNELANRYDFDLTESNADAIEGADVVLLTVKPRSLDAVFSDLRGKLTDGQVVVSIAAGATISRLLSGLGHPQNRPGDAEHTVADRSGDDRLDGDAGRVGSAERDGRGGVERDGQGGQGQGREQRSIWRPRSQAPVKPTSS
ncbi:MAG: NAD(P)-binding domain-containing protein [Thermomicrobiales bacterium]